MSCGCTHGTKCCRMCMVGWNMVRRSYGWSVVRIVRIDVAYGRQFAGLGILVNKKFVLIARKYSGIRQVISNLSCMYFDFQLSTIINVNTQFSSNLYIYHNFNIDCIFQTFKAVLFHFNLVTYHCSKVSVFRIKTTHLLIVRNDLV